MSNTEQLKLWIVSTPEYISAWSRWVVVAGDKDSAIQRVRDNSFTDYPELDCEEVLLTETRIVLDNSECL